MPAETDSSSATASSDDGDGGSRSSPTPASTAAGSAAVSGSEEPEEVAGGDVEGAVTAECLEWFKDVIRRIKGQKQRPDLERIIRMLKTDVGDPKRVARDRELARLATWNEDRLDKYIKSQLSFAIKAGHLFKVWSNDMPSYKDTENLRQLRKFTVGTDQEVRRAVKAALREIGEKRGTTDKDIVRYISYAFRYVFLDPSSPFMDRYTN